MRVLAVGAHPDDIEFLCAGTLARYAQRGDSVIMAVATNGEVGSATLPREEIAAVRKSEAKAAAAVIDAELIWMGYPDEFLFDGDETRHTFIDMVRRANPDVIFAHYPSDYHPDHNTCGSIIRDLKVMTSVPNIETPTRVMDHIPEIFFMDTIAGVGFEPEEYVDISETIELKKQMLACHESQSSWLERQYGMSYVEFMDIVNRFRGIQIGVKYAEAFRFCRSWPSGIGRKLLP